MKLLFALTSMLISLSTLAGCFNMPTPPSQITAAYRSGMGLESFDCSRLLHEYESLTRREEQLVVAQQQRIDTSEMQAFWLGFGSGDGIEASELANVRGETEATRRAMAIKGCALSKSNAVNFSAQEEREEPRSSTFRSRKMSAD